jgi:hypothetical protein
VDKKLRVNGVSLVGEFRGTLKLHKFKCKKGHTWGCRTADLLYCAKGCPSCQVGRVSEEKVRIVIETLTGFKFPKAWPHWMRSTNKHSYLSLDGYCEKLCSSKHPLGVAFEYQGQQHYSLVNFGGQKDTLQRLKRRHLVDERKRISCLRHGVFLIRVPYNIYDIKEFITKRLQSFGLHKSKLCDS